MSTSSPTEPGPPRQPSTPGAYSDPAPEGRIGGYILVREVGHGAMGEVYLARDPRLDRNVAIKMMRCEIAAIPQYIERFRREARAIARLSHQHIIQVYDIGEDNGMMYFVMEWIDGMTLSEKLETVGALPRKEALRIVQQAADALDYACSQNVIHRDIKPGNIMLDKLGRVRVADFGLAKLADSDTYMTSTGTPLGSPNFMSPEACEGKELDFRSDIYSLGVTFYQMLNGDLPFNAPTPMSVMYKHVHEPLPQPMALQILDQGIWMDVLRKMTAKNRDERYKSYAELREALSILDSASTASLHGGIITPARGTPVGGSALSGTSLTMTPGTLHSKAPVVKSSMNLKPILIGLVAIAAIAVATIGGVLWFDSTSGSSYTPPSQSPVAAEPIPARQIDGANIGYQVPQQPQPPDVQQTAMPPPPPSAGIVGGAPPVPANPQLPTFLQAISPGLHNAYTQYDFREAARLAEEAAANPATSAANKQVLGSVVPSLAFLRGFREELISGISRKPGKHSINQEKHGQITVVSADSNGLTAQSAQGNLQLKWSDLEAYDLVMLGRQFSVPGRGFKEKNDALIALYPDLAADMHEERMAGGGPGRGPGGEHRAGPPGMAGQSPAGGARGQRGPQRQQR